MKVRCIANTGNALKEYKRKPFGTTEFTTYGQLSIGEEYLVMGMLLVQESLAYLIDSGRVIGACPIQLFDLTDDRIPSNWHFKSNFSLQTPSPNIECIWGYWELTYDYDHYEELIDMNEKASIIYFKRKAETLQALGSSI